MNRIFLIPLALFLSCGTANKQPNTTQNSDQLLKDVEVLASDAYEGRETGKKGAWMAAEYIKKQFKSFGLIKSL